MKRGELWVKTDTTTTGYFNNPEETSKGFSVIIFFFFSRISIFFFFFEKIKEDGYFRTGDVVELFSENPGRIKIIDRVKNIFKLAQVKFIHFFFFL